MRVWIEIIHPAAVFDERAVTLCVRVWIEIKWYQLFIGKDLVTLCVRVWIEILSPHISHVARISHPLREGVD